MSNVYVILWLLSGWFCDHHVDAVADLALRKVQYCTIHEASYWADKEYPFRADALMRAVKTVTDEAGMKCITIWDPLCGRSREEPSRVNVQAAMNHTRQFYSGIWDISLKQIRPAPSGWFED